ncbi:MAG: hypothetical protein ACFFDN_02500 [Candidatus Hodarchaeota archaeon]
MNITSFITIFFSVGVSVTFAFMAFLLKKSIVEKLDNVELRINEVAEKITSFREEVIKDYVRREDYAKNENSHREMWKEINEVRERIAKVEAK